MDLPRKAFALLVPLGGTVLVPFGDEDYAGVGLSAVDERLELLEPVSYTHLTLPTILRV